MLTAQEILLSPYFLGFAGLAVGSFINVVVHRLPKILERDWLQESADMLTDPDELVRATGLSAAEASKVSQTSESLVKHLEGLAPLGLSKPRSRCPKCGHQIKWYENIPVLSWLALRARCSDCSEPISARYPAVEMLTAVLFAWVGVMFGPTWNSLVWCGFVGLLLTLALIDWDTTLLPDVINQPLLWAGLLASLAGYTLPLSASVIGAMVGYMSLWSVYWLFKLTTGREGMGYGDFKLLAALGAWLGFKMILPILIASSVAGIVGAIIMKMGPGLREGRYVPFGPFLAAGGLGVLFLGSEKVMSMLGW